MKMMYYCSLLLTIILWVEAQQIPLPNKVCEFGSSPVCAINIQGDKLHFNDRCDFNAFNRNFIAFGIVGLREESCTLSDPASASLPFCDTTPESSGPVCGITTACSYTFNDICDFERANQASLKWSNYGFGRCEDLLPQSSLGINSNFNTTPSPSTLSTTTPPPTSTPSTNCNSSLNPISLGQQIQPGQNLPLTKGFVVPSQNQIPPKQTFNISVQPINRPLPPSVILPQTANTHPKIPNGYFNPELNRPYTKENEIPFQPAGREQKMSRIVFRNMPDNGPESPRPFSYDSSPELIDLSDIYRYL